MANKENGGGDDRRAQVADGYVILPRALRDHAIRRMPPRYWSLFTYLLLGARWDHAPHVIGSVTIRRGQLLKSFGKIAEENEWVENRQVKRWSKSTVGRMMDWLCEVGEVSTLGTELGTLITLRKFNDYQALGGYQQRTLDGTLDDCDTIERKIKIKKTYTPDFESVWQVHRRGSKSKAFEEYLKAVPSVITTEELLRQWTAYVQLTVRPDFQGTHLHRWIKDERWDEELANKLPSGNGPGRLARV